MVARLELRQIEVLSRAELRTWLENNHRQTNSIWLVTYRRPSLHYIPYDQIVDEALCYGWVDSQPRSLDQRRSMRLLSPRRRGSNWSKINKDRVTKLTASGLMRAAGLAVAEAAKQDGTWNALDQVELLEVPADLQIAFAGNKVAWLNFDRFPRSSKRLILEWINSAKKPDTRKKRIEETVTEAQVGKRAHHARQIAGI